MPISGTKAGQAVIKIRADGSSLDDDLKRAKKRLQKFEGEVRKARDQQSSGRGAGRGGYEQVGEQFRSFKQNVKQLLGVYAGASAMREVSQSLQNAQEQINLIGRSSRMSSSHIAGLRVGLSRAGVSASVFASGMENLQKNARFAGNSFQQLEAAADRISKLPSWGAREAEAVKLFGTEGRSLLPILEHGAAGLAAMRKEADALGITLGTSVVQGTRLMKNTMRDWELLKENFKATVGADLAGAMGPNPGNPDSGLFARLGKIQSFGRKYGYWWGTGGLSPGSSAFGSAASTGQDRAVWMDPMAPHQSPSAKAWQSMSPRDRARGETADLLMELKRIRAATETTQKHFENARNRPDRVW